MKCFLNGYNVNDLSIPIMFLEEGEFLGTGFIGYPRSEHLYCRTCGKVHAQALVENPVEHNYRSVPCRSHWRLPLHFMEDPTIFTEHWTRLPTYYPIEVLQRDFLLLTEPT